MGFYGEREGKRDISHTVHQTGLNETSQALPGQELTGGGQPVQGLSGEITVNVQNPQPVLGGTDTTGPGKQRAVVDIGGLVPTKLVASNEDAGIVTDAGDSGDLPPGNNETAKGEVPDPHKKPFKLFLGEQDASDSGLASLKTWEACVDKMFAAHPTGKIAVVYECADGTRETSERITREVAEKRVEPSLAIQHAWGFISSGRYNYDRAMVFNRIAEKYPGQLYLVQEWEPEGTADRMHYWSGKYFQDNADKLPITDEELTQEREKVIARALVQKETHAQMKSIIADVLAQEDVVGGVGLVGLSRPGVSQALTAEEYTVNTVFLDMVNEDDRPEEAQETFYHSPTINLDILAESSDITVTNEDVLLAIRGEQRALVELKKNGWKDVQGVLKRTYEWMQEQQTVGVERLKYGDPIYQLEQQQRQEALQERRALAALDSQLTTSGEQESTPAAQITDEQWYGARDGLVRFAETDSEEIGNITTVEDLDRFLGDTFSNINTLVISHPNTGAVSIYDNILDPGRLVKVGTEENFDIQLDSKTPNPTRVKIVSGSGKLGIRVDRYAKTVGKGFHKDQSILSIEPLPIGESVTATLADAGGLELQLIAAQTLEFVQNYLWIFGTTHENFF